jgi:hypothetical protein
MSIYHLGADLKFGNHSSMTKAESNWVLVRKRDEENNNVLFEN